MLPNLTLEPAPTGRCWEGAKGSLFCSAIATKLFRKKRRSSEVQSSAILKHASQLNSWHVSLLPTSAFLMIPGGKRSALSEGPPCVSVPQALPGAVLPGAAWEWGVGRTGKGTWVWKCFRQAPTGLGNSHSNTDNTEVMCPKLANLQEWINALHNELLPCPCYLSGFPALVKAEVLRWLQLN